MGSGGHWAIYGVPEDELLIRDESGDYVGPIDLDPDDEDNDDLATAEAGNVCGIVAFETDNGTGIEELPTDAIEKAIKKWNEHIESGHFKTDTQPKLYLCRYWD